MLVEYDLENSRFETGLKLKGARVKADQSAIPTAMVCYPQTGKEAFIMTVGFYFRLPLEA